MNNRLRFLLAVGLLVGACVWSTPAVASDPDDSHRAATEIADSSTAEVADHGAAVEGGVHGEEHVAGDAHDEADAHAEGEAHGDAHGGDPYHLINLIGVVTGLMRSGGEDPAAATFLTRFQDPIFSAVAALIIVLIFARVYTRRTQDPTRLQAAVEIVVDGLYNMFEAVIGPSARRYTPYLGTLFLFILINNLMGLVPLMHASTSSINTTLALALCTFFYVQYIGIKENGIGGYLHHLAGSPSSGVEWAFVPLMFPLELLGEFIKPVSLSLRLFGNVMGEDKLIAVFIILGAGMLSALHAPFGIPIQVPIMFLALLTSTIQALVFTLLSTVYIALMLPHHDHGDEAHGH